jgi:glucokinase
MKILGAVDIGGTKIAVGAVTENGFIVQRLECPTRPAEGFRVAMRRTNEMLRELERHAGAPYAGIGVASPSPLDAFRGILGEVGTLPGWEGGNLVEAIEDEFGVAVVVENDADAAALAEAEWGSGQGSGSFIYVTISTGIGAGIIVGGKLYRGVDGAHPEIGHMILDASGPKCYCNAPGCWEVLAAGPAMTAWMRAQCPEAGELSAAEICDLARQGHELAWRAVEREGYYIGLGLANLVTVYTPEIIALGGGVMKSADLFLESARQVIRDVATQVPAEKTRLVMASLGADTGLAGAARAWLHRQP